MNNKKTLLFHDRFIIRSGAERMNISMANVLEADIATTIWSTNSYDPDEMGYHGNILEIFKKFRGGWISFVMMKIRLLFSGYITKKYDTIILSNEAITAMHSIKKWTKIIYYAHTLPHVLFDKRKEYLSTVPFFFHEFYHFAIFIRRHLYLYEIRHVDKIATNSEMNKMWLAEWSKRDDIDVIYPAVNTLRFRPSKVKQTFTIEEHNNVESKIEKELHDYYISFSRLEKKKRVDRIIHAFLHMPEKNLVVIYNDYDSETQALMHMARGYNNIFFHCEPNDLKLSKIISSAVASLSLTHFANFWSTALESMACWIPVIAVDEWGYKETVIHEKTGILLPSDFTVYNIIDAVNAITPTRSLAMQKDCIDRANEFSIEKFSAKLKKYVYGIKKEE